MRFHGADRVPYLPQSGDGFRVPQLLQINASIGKRIAQLDQRVALDDVHGVGIAQQIAATVYLFVEGFQQLRDRRALTEESGLECRLSRFVQRSAFLACSPGRVRAVMSMSEGRPTRP